MSFTPYDYKKAERIAAQTKEFYASEKRGVAQIHIKGVAELSEGRMPPLNTFEFPKDMEKYLDLRAERDIRYYEKRSGLADDFIEAIQPWYGIAEHTAFIGGKVDITADTSFQHQILDSIDDMDTLTLDENNMWLRLVVDGIDYLNKKWGKYVPSKIRGADGPSDIANAILGEDLFYAIYDEPERVEELLDFSVKAIDFTLSRQKAKASKIGGGFLNGFGIWMPENGKGHLSEDFSCMISPECYDELFLPALRKLVSGTESSMLHVHSLGRKCIPSFVKLPELNIFELSSDPNNPRAVEVFREYHDLLADRTVIVAPTFEELMQMDDLLKDSKTVVWYYAKTLEEAKEAIAFVRKYPMF